MGVIRVRFAPSPTGALHIGGARTALYNWLAARHAGGTFVLRVEDTDRERSTPENVEQILDALRWLELDYDEGPIFQSQRADRHKEVIAQLLDGGHAYRSTATARGGAPSPTPRRPPRQRGVPAPPLAGGPPSPPPAPAEDVRAYKDRHGADRGFRGEAEPEGAVRLRVADDGATVVKDLIRGE